MDFKQYLILDLETTGIDLFKDRIVKLTTISFSDETVSDTQIKSRLFNPKISISIEAEKIHGISDEDVKNENEFKYYAKSLSDFFENSCIIGFGIYDFHIPILMSEFYRSGVYFDVSKIDIIDLKNVYEKLRPRNLLNALKEFCSVEVDSFDRKSNEKTESILELFLAQQTELSSKNINLNTIIYNDKNIKTLDKEGFFKISHNNDLVFAKGKYENQKITTVKQLHPDYIKWINDNEEISTMVKMILNYEK
jgi:DNA polymerase III epsilon subunit-like protein|tara:strand:+ start:385 stop:1137 length:753 start_codon:yes stop_codon:yes gene_type:complete